MEYGEVEALEVNESMRIQHTTAKGMTRLHTDPATQ
jgi:hypothetical protein